MCDHARLESVSRTKEALRWQTRVRQRRIQNSLDEIGAFTCPAREKAMLEATRAMNQFFGVTDATEIMWLTRRPLIAHQI